MNPAGPVDHILRQLKFPARWEILTAVLGAEVAKLVVPPEEATKEIFETLAEEVRARQEGMLVPITASTGTGKSTLANSLSTFFPKDYAPTARYSDSAVTFENLEKVAADAHSSGKANEKRILPILIDDRESNQPSETELAAIKRFVREPKFGARAVVLWPETSDELAVEMSKRYVKVAGSPAIEIPARIVGPSRDSWQQIAIHTLELANQTSDLELLGVDPRNYAPEESPSLGEFLRRISKDFSDQRVAILKRTQLPIRLSVVFVSKSPDAGVLTQLTNSNRFALLDAGALLSATKTSVIGRYWAENRGLLTQLIVQLDARVFGLTPQVSIPSLRRYGPEQVKADLQTVGITDSAQKLIKNWSRSDFGRYLNGTATATYENRGTPALTSTAAFALLAEQGFVYGKDKSHNQALKSAIEEYLKSQNVEASSYNAETKLSFCALIPDNSFVIDGFQHCVEYTWRAGEFLANSPASVATYVLEKLKNYGRELGQI